jgi:methionyl-tRNA formyltransferase
MRIVIMGTGAFAVPMFAALLHAHHEIPALITRPVPPATGRKKESLIPNPMREFAESRGIPVIAPETANAADAQATLRQLRPDLLVVCDYGEILSSTTLAIAPLGGINLHASLLPKYRGAAPINWAIIKGDKTTGVSVIHMTPKLDGGPLLAIARTPIGMSETSAQLEPRLAQLGVEPVISAIEQLRHWDLVTSLGELQNPTDVTQARRLKKADGDVKWTFTATRIYNRFRGLQPWPGLFTHWHKPHATPIRLLLNRICVVPENENLSVPAGCVSYVTPQQLWVQTGQGQIAIEEVQPAGKRVLSVREFLCGHNLEVGQRFGPLC